MRIRPCRLLLAGGALAIALTLGVSIGHAVDEPANLIKYRQATMKALSGHTGAIAAVVKEEVSFTDEVAMHARAINELSENLLRLFPEGSGEEAGQKTAALPAIWQRWHDFETIVRVLREESGKLAEAAEGGDMAAVRQQFAVLGKNGCGNCHETFRAKQS
jgi:cytochrome c556